MTPRRTRAGTSARTGPGHAGTQRRNHHRTSKGHPHAHRHHRHPRRAAHRARRSPTVSSHWSPPSAPNRWCSSATATNASPRTSPRASPADSTITPQPPPRTRSRHTALSSPPILTPPASSSPKPSSGSADPVSSSRPSPGSQARLPHPWTRPRAPSPRPPAAGALLGANQPAAQPVPHLATDQPRQHQPLNGHYHHAQPDLAHPSNHSRLHTLLAVQPYDPNLTAPTWPVISTPSYGPQTPIRSANWRRRRRPPPAPSTLPTTSHPSPASPPINRSPSP
jgi:hypothetical protein